jgi:hypothetical protein
MCYFLYLASPLTLSEIRAMLPDGVTAHSGGAKEQEMFRAIQRSTQTVAQLLIGRCSCGFVEQAGSPAENERHLRQRYRSLGFTREQIISALERHRVSQQVPPPEEGWRSSLVDFVREHSRNARKSIYDLAFESLSIDPPASSELRQLPVDRVTSSLETWLQEGSPVLITH